MIKFVSFIIVVFSEFTFAIELPETNEIQVINLPYGASLKVSHPNLDYDSFAIANPKEYQFKPIKEGFEIIFHGGQCSLFMIDRKKQINSENITYKYRLCTKPESKVNETTN
jgi:hypothetical protein